MTEWQDISTAPKDGTYFLLCSKETGTIVKAHFNYNALSPTDVEPFSWHIKQCVWMPLPPPPFNKKICHGAHWESIHDHDGIKAKLIQEGIEYKPVTYCPVCGGKNERP